MTHDMYTHEDGSKCVFVSGEWFVPLDAGGEGYSCEKPHFVSNSDMMTSYKRGVSDFVKLIHKHNAVVVREDILVAVACFNVDPSEFYTSEQDQKVLKLEAEIYKLTGKVPN